MATRTFFSARIFLQLATGMLRPDDAGYRLDAGRGLWLRGMGGGRLEAVPGQKSGILVYGEQRGAALGDFDGDGRVDLVVSQNGAETKLYQNVLGKPGLRVRLAGPPGNPDGVGATLRLVFGTSAGSGAGDSWRFGLLVAGQHGAGAWAARKPRRKFGFAGPAAKPPPARSRLAQRKSLWTPMAS